MYILCKLNSIIKQQVVHLKWFPLFLVFTETFRKYPIISFLYRACASDYKLPSPSGKGTVTLPAGTAVFISMLGVQNNPKHFPEPEKFNPDRFTEENKRSRPKYTYIPFGVGLRMCIGNINCFQNEFKVRFL
jgi:cytochrome P450 family 6